MKQVYKGKKLTSAKVVNNIMKIYEQATENERKFNWYVEQNLFAQKLAKRYNVNLSKVVGVISALSPLKSWDENKTIADLFFRTGRVKHTGAMKNKAKRIMALNDANDDDITDILNGNKISSFYLNIRHPLTSDCVTIDRHALDICLGKVSEDNRQTTLNQYLFFQKCYVIAGAKVGIKASLMQSITWVKWIELKNNNNGNNEVPF